MTGPWEDYLVAARELDECRRQAASVTATRAEQLRAARQELAAIRRRAAIGQARLLDMAARAGLPPPAIAPAGPVPPAADPVADLRAARADLDAADAALSGTDRLTQSPGSMSSWSVPARNALVYGGFALVVLVVQVVLLEVVSGQGRSLTASGCAVVLPVFGYALAWLCVGLVFRERGGTGGPTRVDRTPVLGAAIFAAAVLLICAGLGASFLL